MTVAGWLEIALFVAVLTALTPLVGGYMARVFTGELNHARLRRAPALPPARRAPRARPGLEGLRALRARLQRALRSRCSTSSCARRRCTRSTRRTCRRRPGTSRSTPPRRSCRTRTGSSTAARRRCPTSRRWPAWRCRTSSPPPSASPSLAAFIRGFAVALRHGARQLLRRRHARRCSTSCCRSSVIGALFLVSQGVIQNLGDYTTVTTLDRRSSRRSPTARSPRRSRSRSSAPTAAASSTSTRRCRSRTRRAHELRPDADDPGHPRRADRDLRPDGRQPPPGLGGLRGDDDAVRRRRRDRLRRRGPTRRRDARRRACTAPTSRARSSASASAPRRCSPPSRRSPRAARSTPRWSR